MTISRFARRSVLLSALLIALSAPSMSQSAANPGAVTIDHPEAYSQILAVSDMHGEFAHLTTLLISAKVTDTTGRWIAGRTLMVVCGDSIDKGPNGLPILALWMRLESQATAAHGRLLVLLGNHEAEFLADSGNSKAKIFRHELEHAGLSADAVAGGSDAKGIGKFLRRMPLAARIGSYLFSHAGWFPANTTWSRFTTHAKQILTAGHYDDAWITGEHSILEEKDETVAGTDDSARWYDIPDAVKSLETRIRALGLYGVVMGHQPKAFGFDDHIGAVDDLRIIKIDTGMAPDASEGPGEILRFPHPADLLKTAAPAANRMLANGTTSAITQKRVATAIR